MFLYVRGVGTRAHQGHVAGEIGVILHKVALQCRTAKQQVYEARVKQNVVVCLAVVVVVACWSVGDT